MLPFSDCSRHNYEMQKFLLSSALVAGLSLPGLAQEAAPAPAAAKASPYTSILGAVTAVGADGKQITLKPDTGAESNVNLDAKTHFMKVAPGEKDLKKAAEAQFSDISVGDRVLARVRKMDDGSVAPATTVVVMSKSEIVKQQERDQAEWQTRGVVGTVTAVDPATKSVTLKTQGADGKQVVIDAAPKVSVRKYAPNSVKFSDATQSSMADIKNGDTIRVLGAKNDDGSHVVPEQIIFGTIIRQAGTILAIDAAAGTVKMNDLATKKPVIIKVNSSTSMKKLPEMVAAMMARSQNGGGQGAPGAAAAGGGERGPGSGPGSGMRPENGRPGPGAGADSRAAAGAGSSGVPGSGAPFGMGAPGGPGGMGGRRMDPARMLERLPQITLADLKVGDAIMISSSGGAEPTAISLVAGVEALLTAPARPGQAAGPNLSWNFEMSIPQ